MSDAIDLYPLLLNPSLHVKVWGGRRLGEIMGKSLPTDEPYGESWEMHDTSTVMNGPLAGRTLGDLLEAYGAALAGADADPAAGMPLLVKLIDASQWLSVQVHPNDAQAIRLEGDLRGKTEAWVILVAEQGAQLVIGVDAAITREEMAQAIRDNRLEDKLIYADVRPGDVLYIRAGTIHAIGPGILLYEIQQSSDTTYRLYDWGRMGLDGTPRELHVDKGVEVSNIDAPPRIEHPDGSATVTMVGGEYFQTMLHRLDENMRPAQVLDTYSKRFHALTCIKGSVRVVAGDLTVGFAQGQTVLVPASVGYYTLSGTGEVLRSWQGD